MYPSNYRYSREHEWISIDGDIATLGITDFAQQELGEVVYAELPDSGQKFNAGDEIGTIESVKAVAEFYTPLTGEIVEKNDSVIDNPELVNDDPHGEGWLVKIRLSSPSDASSLMSAAQYEEYIKSEE